jgi:hypothetical protein
MHRVDTDHGLTQRFTLAQLAEEQKNELIPAGKGANPVIAMMFINDRFKIKS